MTWKLRPAGRERPRRRVASARPGDRRHGRDPRLAARFRRPLPVILGILVATLVNHAIAALIGVEAAGLLESVWFRLAVALGFVAMAAWTLVPDRLDEQDVDKERTSRRGAFLTTLVSFFLVEIGDKTQIATMALGARYHSVLEVAAGTTLGMMLVNIPAVLGGETIVRMVSLKLMRLLAAGLMAGIGLWSLRELPR